jgi:membrane protein YqaA with SNARE-associated domain
MGLELTRIQPPPRPIGPHLAAQMMLGGIWSQVGWVLFGFGSIFYWLLGYHADLSGFRFRESSIARVQGTVLDCRDTNTAVNDEEVIENRYRYELNGIVYSGLSYDTGRCLEGEAASIEYLKDRPEFSRVQGMRRDRFGPWAVLVAGFPGFGLAVVILCLRAGAGRVRLLRHGVAVPGRFVGKEPTNTRINEKMVYRVAMDYTAQDGSTHRATVKTTNPQVLHDQAREAVLYDPARPDRSVPIDSLPGKLKLDRDGRFQSGGSWGLLIVPVLSIALNALLMSLVLGA